MNTGHDLPPITFEVSYYNDQLAASEGYPDWVKKHARIWERARLSGVTMLTAALEIAEDDFGNYRKSVQKTPLKRGRFSLEPFTNEAVPGFMRAARDYVAYSMLGVFETFRERGEFGPTVHAQFHRAYNISVSDFWDQTIAEWAKIWNEYDRKLLNESCPQNCLNEFDLESFKNSLLRGGIGNGGNGPLVDLLYPLGQHLNRNIRPVFEFQYSWKLKASHTSYSQFGRWVTEATAKASTFFRANWQSFLREGASSERKGSCSELLLQIRQWIEFYVSDHFVRLYPQEEHLGQEVSSVLKCMWFEGDRSLRDEVEVAIAEYMQETRKVGMSGAVQPTPLDSATPTDGTFATPTGNYQPEKPNLRRFRKKDNHWQIVFDGKGVELNHQLGLHYLSLMLAYPDRDISCLELVALVRKNEQIIIDRLTQPTLDRRAQAAYKERLLEIVAEAYAPQAKKTRVSSLDAEFKHVSRELAISKGRGNADRSFTASFERARKSVGNRVRCALKTIRDKHPALGEFLDTHVALGGTCVYRGDGREWGH